MYDITNYTKQKAKSLNVEIRPSTRKNKKIDVYKNNQKVATIGDSRYADYPTYIKTKGKEYADKRRQLYRKRHEKDRNKADTPGYYADKLLW